MKTFIKPSVNPASVFARAAAFVLLMHAVAASAASPTPPTKSDADLRQQIADLQAKVKQLETAAPTPMPGMSSSPNSGSMSMGMDDMKMGSMPSSSPATSGMPATSMPGGNMMDMMKMMGAMNMAAMSSPSASGMSGMPQSALPGFPGVSHLYHIGATGFFLDHAGHINLSTDQQSALNKVKEQALAAKQHSDHQIEQAEQELGQLTSADQPDAAKIDAKVREIEKLRSDERLAFIRSVGDAAKLLTDDQRKILVGAMQPNQAMPSPSMSPMSHM